jgi:hypothetical protein
MRVEDLEDTVQKRQELEQAAYDEIEEMKTQQKERRNQFKEEIDRYSVTTRSFLRNWILQGEKWRNLKLHVRNTMPLSMRKAHC